MKIVSTSETPFLRTYSLQKAGTAGRRIHALKTKCMPTLSFVILKASRTFCQGVKEAGGHILSLREDCSRKSLDDRHWQRTWACSPLGQRQNSRSLRGGARKTGLLQSSMSTGDVNRFLTLGKNIEGHIKVKKKHGKTQSVVQGWKGEDNKGLGRNSITMKIRSN